MKGHRVVLALFSPLLATVFQNQCVHQDCYLILSDYSSIAISSFLRFCYFGETVVVDEPSVDEFILLCRELAVPIPVPIELIGNKKLVEIVKSEEKDSQDVSVETIFFDENDFEPNEDDEMKEEYLQEEKIKYEETTEYQRIEEQDPEPDPEEKNQKHKEFPIKKTIAKKVTVAPAVTKFNLASLKEEQEKFKKRLQQAISSCKNGTNSIKKVKL